MIDFKNAAFVKLRPVNDNAFEKMIAPILVGGEAIIGSYQSLRDGVVFTDKRVISANVQGITGKKVDYTSLPYSKVQAYSVETAGTFDRDCELDLFYSGIGRVRFEIRGSCDIVALSKLISTFIL